ncbi:MAG: TetR/AcrR family transcriptional regulator [Dehalococcoidia bacterium]|nr:TetR/AcrR family transcriptional regulator [Dehalococcoidia bacterium]MDD5493846.1 TetR/AcrR family transcriptional regulator [Dehalococcoidia bacterium]
MDRKSNSNLPRKAQIVNAARKLVIKMGSENVTVRRIAEEVGFTEAAVYRHFKSKKEILYLLVENIEDSLISDLTIGGDADSDIFETILLRHLSAIEKRRGVSFQVIAEIISLGDDKLNRRIYDTIERYLEKLKTILKQEVSKGKLRRDIDLDAVAFLIFSVMQGLSNIWTLSNYGFNPKDKFKTILSTLKMGLIDKKD